MTDLIVIGAGPAGIACAIAARRLGRTVTLAGPTPRHRPRTLEVLSDRARPTLDCLGLTEMVTGCATACAGLRARWGSAEFDRESFLDPDAGGWIVDRAELDPRLLEAAQSTGCAFVASPVTTIERNGRRWRARIGSSWLHGDRVVVATGGSSPLVGRCGVRRQTSHQLAAIVAWSGECPAELRDRLTVASAGDGWWYAIGRSGGTSFGFVTDRDLLLPGPDRARVNWEFQRARFGWPDHDRTGGGIRAALVGSVELPFPDGIQVVGDAALSVDPLSGHGLTLAFESAWRAASDHPVDYTEWLSQQIADHRDQQKEVYAAAGLGGVFWERRSR